MQMMGFLSLEICIADQDVRDSRNELWWSQGDMMDTLAFPVRYSERGNIWGRGVIYLFMTRVEHLCTFNFPKAPPADIHHLRSHPVLQAYASASSPSAGI
jgi:hypothetical protein